jgi:hypothetical protein
MQDRMATFGWLFVARNTNALSHFHVETFVLNLP